MSKRTESWDCMRSKSEETENTHSLEGQEQTLREKERVEFFTSTVTKSLGAIISAYDKMPTNVERIARATHEVTSTVAVAVVRIATKQSMGKEVPEEVEFAENENRRPLLDIIKDGIHDFMLDNTDTRVVWARSEGYYSSEDFIRLMQQPMYDSTESETVLEVVLNQLFEEEGYANSRNMLMRALPNDLAVIIAGMEYEIYSRCQVDSAFFEDVRNVVEEEYEKNKTPVSASKILSLCLEYREGDLSKALTDWGDCLKYLTRSDFEDAFDDALWVQKYIKDEYSDFVSYQDLPGYGVLHYGKHPPFEHTILEPVGTLATRKHPKSEDANYYENVYFNYSICNQVGKPYHAAHIASLLQYFSPEVIMAMVGVEYAKHGPEQGLSKLLADVRTVSELYTIKEFVESYQVGNSERN